MGETGNTAKIAEFVSKDIFSIFGWRVSGSTNINWNCVNPEHSNTTHPADIVFSYADPYKNRMTYVLSDLKSYSKGSITKNSIKKALVDLNKSLSCAKVSSDWRDKFVDTENNYDIKGMLFIYNHDGEFVERDHEFSTLLDDACRTLDLDEGNLIYVVGPSTIHYLINVANNIKLLCADKKLPLDMNDRGFYYPELDREKLFHDKARLPLSIESMAANFHVMRYAKGSAEKIDGLDIYMKGPGDSTDSFMHLIDFIRLNNCLQDSPAIRVFLPFGGSEARRKFEKALNIYVDGLDSPTTESIKKLVSFEHCPTIVKHQYFNEEIGMRHGN